MSGTTARSRFQAPPSPISTGGPARAESPPLKTRAPPTSPENFDVECTLTMPLISLLLTLRLHIRNYLYWQVEWTTLNILPWFAHFRSSKAWHRFFVISSLCGEEEFYQALIPLLLYNSNSNCVWARGLIVVFISSLLIGDFLKSLLALPRPPIQRFLVGAERFDADAVDNRDFGWPSTHASNALAVPFFLVHQFGCGVWPLLVGALTGGSADAATAGGIGWTLALLINAGALAWMLSISVSRMYLGMHSPADVQGGLILGALCLRAWEWIGPTMFVGWMQAAWTPATAFAASVAFLLCQPRPAKPIVNYTFLESVNLVGFLQSFVGGSWLRWDAQRADLHVAQIWEMTASSSSSAWAPWTVALARNAVGFTFFIVTHIVTKKLFQVVCAKLLGPSTPRTLPALNPRKYVVTKDISCDFHKVAARFLTYTYLGYMATYLVPRIFDAMQLWA